MHITSATSLGPTCTLRNAVQPNQRLCVPYSLICRFPSGIRPAESASSSKPRRYVHALRKCTAQHRIVRSEAASFTEETTKAANPLRIVFVSAEVGPWSKTGGLGDVVGGLPIALAQRGHNVLTIAPRYDQYADAWDTSVTRNIDGQEVRYFHTKKNGVDRVWIDNDAFLAKVWGKTGGKLYGQRSGSDYSDNQKRFVLFNKAAIEALTALPFSPGEDCVVVANDWHTAMFPVLLKDQYQPNGQFSKTKVAFCVHNIAYQGRFWEEQFESLQVPSASKSKFAFEDGNPRVYDETEPDTADKPVLGDKGRKYKKVNWMKAAFLSADKLLTVSPTYATEIAANESQGVELDGVIRQAGGVEGIVNGMDTTDWSPNVDKFLDVKYDADTVDEGKVLAKEALQAELGLPVDASVPLFGYIGRLEEQKGVDILLAALPKALQSSNIQVAILGTGKFATKHCTPAVMVKTVVIDARGHMLGRLASILAKQMLNGQQVVVVRAEEICISGGLVRQKMKYERFLRKRMNTQPSHGPIHFRAPSKILWRTIRGMVPHKTKRGAAALDRFKAYEGVPPPYDKVKRLVVPDALKVLRLQHGHKFCKLGDLSNSVGWKHQEAVKELEEVRKVRSHDYYVAKRKLKALKTKATATVEGQA